MTQQEYEHKKAECWEKASRRYGISLMNGTIHAAFNFAFDRAYTIVKDSFRNERRLNIAAQIVASMVGSDDWTTWRGGSNKEIWHNMAKSSLEIADALLAEVEKKGDEE